MAASTIIDLTRDDSTVSGEDDVIDLSDSPLSKKHKAKEFKECSDEILGQRVTTEEVPPEEAAAETAASEGVSPTEIDRSNLLLAELRRAR